MLIACCFSSRSGESVYLNHVCITILGLTGSLFALGKRHQKRKKKIVNAPILRQWLISLEIDTVYSLLEGLDYLRI